MADRSAQHASQCAAERDQLGQDRRRRAKQVIGRRQHCGTIEQLSDRQARLELARQVIGCQARRSVGHWPDATGKDGKDVGRREVDPRGGEQHSRGAIDHSAQGRDPLSSTFDQRRSLGQEERNVGAEASRQGKA